MLKIIELEAEAHLKLCFKHFIYFILEYKLVDKRELAPLDDTLNQLVMEDYREEERKRKIRPCQRDRYIRRYQ